MPFPAALFEVDIVATPFVVAVVNDVAVVCDVAVVDDVTVVNDVTVVDGVAVVNDVAVVDGVAMRPSSTELMSSGEAGVLTPGLSSQLGCLNIWIG